MTIDNFGRIVDLLSGIKFSVSDEVSMQHALAKTLTDAGVNYVREWDAKPYGRVDFYCDGIAIELKIKGAKAAIRRQLRRYAEHQKITSVILLTTRRQLMGPAQIVNGKLQLCIYVGNSF